MTPEQRALWHVHTLVRHPMYHMSTCVTCGLRISEALRCDLPALKARFI